MNEYEHKVIILKTFHNIERQPQQRILIKKMIRDGKIIKRITLDIDYHPL